MSLDIKPEELQFLDYPKGLITMYVTTEVERTARVNACAKEPESVEFIESLPKTAVFFDIGSNVGSYAFVAAANNLKTYAFEPPGPTYERLEDNVLLNPTLKVFAHPVLLGDENRMVRFSYSSVEPGSALHRMGWGPRSEAMQMRTLDSYVIDKSLPWPTAMKIDTDGNELRVLIGAQECLKHVKALQVELDDSPMSEQVHHFLGKHGFAQTKVTKHEWSGVSNCRYDRFETA